MSLTLHPGCIESVPSPITLAVLTWTQYTLGSVLGSRSLLVPYPNRQVLSSVGLALGWACFIFFQFYTQCVINRQISMEVESDDFARQFVAPSGDPRFRDIQTSFRLAVGMELMAILCILGAALLRSYAFVKKASCVGMVTS